MAEFKNLLPFHVRFAPVEVRKTRVKGEYVVCYPGSDDTEYIQHGSADYIEGWLYGATMAACGQIRRARSEYPELEKYDEDHQYDLNREDDDTPVDELGRYEIVFEAAGERFYCFVDALNVDEALGQFFCAHPNITFRMVIEQLEV